MTFLEKIRAMSPERDEDSFDADVVMLCPSDLGLEDETPPSCPNLRLKAGTIDDCRKCWNREVPE